MAELRPRLRKRIDDAEPRVLRIVAPAGFGKTTLARGLIASNGGALCDLTDLADIGDLEHRIDAALGDPEPSGTGAVLERWKAMPRGWFVLDGIDEALAVPGGAELVRLLVRALPPGRGLVLTARTAIPFDLTRGVAPHELLTLTEYDLAFDDATRRALIDADGTVDPAVVERAVRRSHGWPIATLLFARLAREGTLAMLIDRLDDERFADLHDYVGTHVLGELEPATYRVLLACCAIPEATAGDVAEALGRERSAVLPALDDPHAPIARSGAVYRVHSLIGAALRRTAPDEVRALQTAYANQLFARGDHLRAAELWLHAGDDRAAAAAFDAQEPLPAGERASPRAVRFVRRLPLEVVLASRHAFDILLTSARTRAAPFELLDRLQDAVAKLEPGADPALRASASLALGVLLRMVQRHREAEAALQEVAADGHLAAERRPLLDANRALVAAQLGRLAQAHRIWRDGRLSDDSGGTAFVLEQLELELSTALPSGTFEEIHERHTSLLRTVAQEADDPVVTLFCRAMEVLYGRLGGEIGSAAAFLQSFDAETARPELAHLVVSTDPARRRATAWTIVTTLDLALHQTDVQTARRLVDLAIADADATGMPHFRASTRIVAAFIPGNDAKRLFAEALTAAREVDEPLLAASVETIAAGNVPSRGPFRTLLAKVERSPFIVAISSLRIELLRGEATRAGVALPIRARDFELLAALALARGPISRAALSERLWPDGGDEENPALRMSVHRLRRQLGEPDALLTEGMAYRLGTSVAVDIDEIAMFLGAVRQLPMLSGDEQDRLVRMFEALAAPLPERYAAWEWFAPHAARIGDLRNAVGTLLAESFLRATKPDDALRVAEALRLIDPADEPAAELAIRAHLAAGRRPEATRAYRLYRAVLAADFGAEPSPELGELLRGERVPVTAR